METFGGVESFLLQYYKNINRDYITFDFLMCCNNTFEKYEADPIFSESKLIALHALNVGGNKISNYKKMVEGVNGYLQENEYDVVHINTSNVLLQTYLAKYMKCSSIRIAHSHSATPRQAKETFKSRIKKLIKNLYTHHCQTIICKNNDYLFACSMNAGEALFGKRGIQNIKFRVIKNAIDTIPYRFDVSIRDSIRSQQQVSPSCIVYGTVGRLAESKNLLFLLDLFKKLHQSNQKIKLWIVGEGPMRAKLESKIQAEHLESSVTLFGEQNDVPRFLMGMDYFIFPTVYEGLGIVAIEAQATGLPVIASNAVPAEARISDYYYSVSLNSSIENWINVINTVPRNFKREDGWRNAKKNGYDIESSSEELLSFYKEIGAKIR